MRKLTVKDILAAKGIKKFYDTCVNVSNSGKECLNNFVSSDELNMMIIGLRRFTKINPINIKDTRRR